MEATAAPRTWFSSLFGFDECADGSGAAYERVQRLLRVEPDTTTSTTLCGDDGHRSSALIIGEPLHLVSTVNGARYPVGSFSTPTLRELRAAGAATLAAAAGRDATSAATSTTATTATTSGVTLTHAAVPSAMEAHAAHPGAVFQVASQLNCLEFVSPNVTPEDGVTGYERDRTQGPDCALACAPAAVWRNYCMPLPAPPGGEPTRGQRADHQLDTLRTLGEAVGNPAHDYWRVRNGYVSAGARGEAGVRALGDLLRGASTGEVDALRDAVRIGVHDGVGVVFARRWQPAPGADDSGGPPRVTQALCSALSLGAYAGGVPSAAWEPVARLVLEAAYEATLWAGVLTAARTGVTDVLLTFMGGGVFGNAPAWIHEAIGRAVALVGTAGASLSVRLCHYQRVDEAARASVDGAVAAAARRGV
jgi:hypothetical protein